MKPVPPEALAAYVGEQRFVCEVASSLFIV